MSEEFRPVPVTWVPELPGDDNNPVYDQHWNKLVFWKKVTEEELNALFAILDELEKSCATGEDDEGEIIDRLLIAWRQLKEKPQ